MFLLPAQTIREMAVPAGRGATEAPVGAEAEAARVAPAGTAVNPANRVNLANLVSPANLVDNPDQGTAQ